VNPSSNYNRLLAWLDRNMPKTNFFVHHPFSRHFIFRCQPNKSCSNSTLTWMLWNKIKLVTWLPRQITIGYCYWRETCKNNFFVNQLFSRHFSGQIPVARKPDRTFLGCESLEVCITETFRNVHYSHWYSWISMHPWRACRAVLFLERRIDSNIKWL